MPIVLIGYYLLPFIGQNRFLLLASLVFYAWWDWRFLGLLGLTVVVDYYASHAIKKAPTPQRKKLWLRLSIGTNLLVLGVFKYANFGITSFEAMLRGIGFHVNPITIQLALPIGISFYTFMSMAYVIDVYWDKFDPVDDFFDFALFVSYFPHLVAGPILRAHQLIPQLTHERRVSKEQIRDGLALMLVGYLRKVLIADTLASIVDRAFLNPAGMSSTDLVVRLWLCAIQIYGDFAGYSDIARGVSKLFGIELHLNFATPLLSQNITEFWRRWHISLSSWLRDYVYIPLGGNRKGHARAYLNLLITMFVSGLWHGANWTFVAFGAVHGISLSVHKAWASWRGETIPKHYGTNPWTFWTPFKVFVTFNLFAFSLVLFRSPSFGAAANYIANIFMFRPGMRFGETLFVLPFVLLTLAMDSLQYTHFGVELLGRMNVVTRAVVLGTLLALVLIAGSDNSLPFVYFQF
ncbi:MAG: MBOAT family O-acyltransferase [Bacteroidota bacterium]|nr:MBOAT family O-acyltransferase [Bacteroidota bacterium]